MKIKDFLEGNNTKAIDPKIEAEIVDAAKEVGVGVRSIVISKDKKVVGLYYNFGDEAYDGQLKDKSQIFQKLNPIATKLLKKNGFDVKQSLRSNYDKNVGCIFYFTRDEKPE